MKVRGKKRNVWLRSSAYAALLVCAIFMAFPYYWMVVTTLKPPQEVYVSGINLLPSRLSLGVYPKVLTNPELPAVRFFLNSLLISVGATVVATVTAILAAYPLARRKVPGGRIAYLLVIATMMMPGEVVIVGIFMVIRLLGMIDTYQGVFFPLAVYAVVFLIVHNYMRQLPRELDESALMDGANHWQILSRIILPISQPAVYSAILLAFLHAWQNFTIPYVLMLSQNLYPLSVGALFIESELYATMQETLSLSTLLTIPTLILFILTQRFVFSGITAGAVKG